MRTETLDFGRRRRWPRCVVSLAGASTSEWFIAFQEVLSSTACDPVTHCAGVLSHCPHRNAPLAHSLLQQLPSNTDSLNTTDTQSNARVPWPCLSSSSAWVWSDVMLQNFSSESMIHQLTAAHSTCPNPAWPPRCAGMPQSTHGQRGAKGDSPTDVPWQFQPQCSH